jgi:hypothetical protein
MTQRIKMKIVGVCFLAACNKSAPLLEHAKAPIVFSSVAPTSVAPSSELPPPTSTQACSATLRAYQTSEMERARKESKLANEAFEHFDSWTSASAETPQLLCASSWALVAKSFTLSRVAPMNVQKASCDYPGENRLCVKFALVHESLDGKLQEQALAMTYAFSFGVDWYFQPFKTLAYDFDGDGSPEWLMILEKYTFESTSEHVIVGFSFQGGTINSFATPLDAYPEEFRDVDGDGRPDLIGHLNYSSDQLISCGSGFEGRLSGPNLLWHSVVGGKFEAADDAAKAFARTSCGAKPEAGKVFAGEARDQESNYAGYDLLAARGLCARMWGVSAADLRREMPKTPGLTGKCDSGEVVPLRGQTRTVLSQWLSKPPPFLF